MRGVIYIGIILSVLLGELRAQLIADFSFSTSCAEHIVEFTNTSSLTAISYAWDFGDGTSSVLRNPVHKYNANGNFNVELTVSDGVSVVSKTQLVVVNRNIPLDISNCFCEPPSYVPNYSLEDFSCCPTQMGQLSCADSWSQASAATSDYLNTCGMINRPGTNPPPFPLPNGNGYAGVWNGFNSNFYPIASDQGYKEYLGACLTSTLKAGSSYELSFYVANGGGINNIKLGIFGSPDCGDLPFGGNDIFFGCPTNAPGWYNLKDTSFVLTQGTWQKVTFVITPTIDIENLVIGPDCAPAVLPPVNILGNYYYFDEIVIKSYEKVEVSKKGKYCDNLTLNAKPTVPEGYFMWFKDNVELLGETADSLDINENNYGPGWYKVMYVLGDFCVLDSIEILDSPNPIADFFVDDICANEFLTAQNFSNISSGSITGFQWNFRGNKYETSNFESYVGVAGVFDLSLIAISDQHCKDTLTKQVVVKALPDVNFTYIPKQPTIFYPEVCFSNQSQNLSWHMWTYGMADSTSYSWEECINYPSKHTGSYQVCLIGQNELNCFDTVCEIVVVEGEKLVYVPNSFTPNKDNVNEMFEPSIDGAILNYYTLSVFDRWGKLLFTSNSPDIGWDGKHQGVSCPIGIYVWKIEAEVVLNENELPHQINTIGHVNLLR